MRTRWLALTTAIALRLGAAAAFADAQPASADTPAETARTVDAEGSAPIVGGDTTAARRAAVQQALREAVERVAGARVRASAQVQNHVVLADRVTTRADGFATLDQVLEERVEGGSYRVKIRTTVRPGPLPYPMRSGDLPRPWRAIVFLPITFDKASPRSSLDGTGAEAELGRCLRSAGLEVIEWRHSLPPAGQVQASVPANASAADLAAWGRRNGADLVISGQILLTLALGMPVPVDWVDIDYARCTAHCTARIVRTETLEETPLESLRAHTEGTSRAQAVRSCVARTAGRLGDSLVERLRPLPGAIAQRIRLTVSGLDTAAEAVRFEDALASAPGVRHVSRLGLGGGALTLEVAVAPGGARYLAAVLEEWRGLSAFRVQIESDTGSSLAARVAAE